MNRTIAVGAALAAAGVLAACRGAGDLYYDGDFEKARAEAAARGTLVMVQFTTEWCSWCRRLEADTLASDEVRREIDGLVAIEQDAENEGRELARRFDVVSYPTVVFTDADGREVDRIVGYRPPDDFVADIRRIRAGDTFVACLEELAEDPADADAVRRAVEGLLERADPESAIERVEAYHRSSSGHREGVCRKLMFEARSALLERVYERVGRLYRDGLDAPPALPDAAGLDHLRGAVEDGLAELPPAAQAARLRQARRDDAAALLTPYREGDIPLEDVGGVADFAFRNGHYELAARAYREWFAGACDRLTADQLNQGAWQLYLARTDLDLALEMARAAWDRERDPDIADTLGRILYLRGDVDEALEIQRRAVETARDGEREFFLDAAERMAAGEPLGDRAPFDVYPGSRETSL